MITRERVRALVEAPWFQASVITLILINAVILGFETSTRMMDNHGDLLKSVDRVILGLFVFEMGLRMFAHRREFFRDPWSWFDMVIIGIALLPASGPFAVLRILRVLRVLRLLSVIPSLRHVVAGLFRAMPGMASIMVLVVLLLYVSAVMATRLFATDAPQYFGDLGTSLFTLFQIFTADGWSNIAAEVMKHQPYAWVFFVVFVMVSTLIALNLFIAVAVEALDKAGHEEQYGRPGQGGAPGAEEGSAPDGDPGDTPDGGASRTPDEGQRQILAELRALRAEVASLRDERELLRGEHERI